MDVDGLAEAEFQAGLAKLKELKITYLAYTTFSFGLPEKPGIRARIAIPIDRALTVDEYSQAWHGANALLWQNKADSSGAKMYQQQGTWSINKSHANDATAWKNTEGVASANFLIQAATAKNTARQKPTESNPYDANRIANSCKQIALFRDNKGEGQSEPLWFDCLGVVGHCQDGEQLCHEWSSGYSQYTVSETEKKLAHRLKKPPTTCEQFKTSNASGCVECTQNCNSPIALGRDIEAEIGKLAKLSKVEYDQVRQASAKNFRIQQKTLDTEVKKFKGSKPDLPFDEIEPYSEPIVPAELLDEIVATLKEFIVLNDDQAIATTLWIAFSWFIDCFEIAPILLINAPEKACGKTQLLDLVGRMSRRPMPVANSSAAFLFRTIELHQPTMLFDEVDTFIKENIEMKGIVNAGHSRSNAFVGRTVGDNHEPKRFSVWCAKAFAGITLDRHLPDATMSRAIVIDMRRKKSDETVSRLRNANKGVFSTIAAKLARFELDYSSELTFPELPEKLSDREQDNWEALLTIAACAGDAWLQRSIQAALNLQANKLSAEDDGNSILLSIYQVFTALDISKIGSAELITCLCADEEGKWANYNFRNSRDTSITPRQLANLLKPYGITTKNLKINKVTKKAYSLEDFQDAFECYLDKAVLAEVDLGIKEEMENWLRMKSLVDGVCY